MIRSNRRIDIEAPSRITITISATIDLTPDYHAVTIAAFTADALIDQAKRIAHDLSRMDEWNWDHPSKQIANDATLDALDTLFPMRSGSIEEEARFIPTPRYRPSRDEKEDQ